MITFELSRGQKMGISAESSTYSISCSLSKRYKLTKCTIERKRMCIKRL